MCLLSVAWQYSAEYPFVFAGNRDEYHARESDAAGWWADTPEILGGRDRVAGGSWLAMHRDGRFAVVTNRPDLPAPVSAALSRGALVTDWLTDKSPDSNPSARTLATQQEFYGGFSLLAGQIDPRKTTFLNCCSGGYRSSGLTTQLLTPGIFGLSNTAPDKPWPKLAWLNRQMQKVARRPEPEALFRLLLRTAPVPGMTRDGVATRPFIAGDSYGTRSATVIIVTQAGHCHFIERRFGPGGKPAGESVFEFGLTG